MKYYSASKLKRGRACLFQMKNEPFKKSDATEFGNSVHAAIAALLATGVDPMETIMKEIPARGLPIGMVDRAADILLRFNEDKRLAISPESIITVESADGEVHHKFPDGTERTMFQVSLVDGWGLQGSIDLVDVRPDGTLRVIDWKTGQTEEEDDLQLAVYALAAWKKYNVPVIETAFYYLERGIYQPSTWTSESLVSALEYVEGIIERIQTADTSGVYPQTPHKNCKWCALKDGCEAFAKQLEQVPDRASWDLPAVPDNLSKIQDYLERLDAVAKAAYGIAEGLKEKRFEVLRDMGGSATIDGRTFRLTERVASYDYDLPSLFIGLQEFLGRAPVDVCKFDSGAFDDMVKSLDKDQKKAVKAIRDRNRSVRSKAQFVSCSISKDPAPAADEAGEEAGAPA